VSKRLVSLAAAVDEIPTVDEIDSMLAELQQMPRDQTSTSLMDDLLDLRTRLAG
jgi:hypothetical protein